MASPCSPSGRRAAGGGPLDDVVRLLRHRLCRPPGEALDVLRPVPRLRAGVRASAASSAAALDRRALRSSPRPRTSSAPSYTSSLSAAIISSSSSVRQCAAAIAMVCLLILLCLRSLGRSIKYIDGYPSGLSSRQLKRLEFQSVSLFVFPNRI